MSIWWILLIAFGVCALICILSCLGSGSSGSSSNRGGGSSSGGSYDYGDDDDW